MSESDSPPSDEEVVIQDAATNVACQVYEQAREDYGIDERNDFRRFLEAASEAESVFHLSRELREQRVAVRPALRRLGLYYHDATTFPPDDLDERIEMLRSGELPDRTVRDDIDKLAKETDD